MTSSVLSSPVFSGARRSCLFAADAILLGRVTYSGNAADEISKLKQQPGRDSVLYGSADLLNSLLRDDVIDEFRIMVFPVLLGSGKRLFRDARDMTIVTRTVQISSRAPTLPSAPSGPWA